MKKLSIILLLLSIIGLNSTSFAVGYKSTAKRGYLSADAFLKKSNLGATSGFPEPGGGGTGEYEGSESEHGVWHNPDDNGEYSGSESEQGLWNTPSDDNGEYGEGEEEQDPWANPEQPLGPLPFAFLALLAMGYGAVKRVRRQ